MLPPILPLTAKRSSARLRRTDSCTLAARQDVEIYDLTAGFSLDKDHHQMLFVDKDRIFSGDLEEGINILKNWR
ncbi:hypothetical protein [Sutterella wadsworthensis]|uniref:hypothetical protein n=1 Tax=Sutterella wadsworthensis TaxID=40545 RepID=UPI001D07DD54|nr:hypothetical protein [Sutterella wadsworthensis]MCB7455360.1 hypothetical protein [Sutterella wadsworthensis]